MFKTLLVLVVWTVFAIGAKPETERRAVAKRVARRKKVFMVVAVFVTEICVESKVFDAVKQV